MAVRAVSLSTMELIPHSLTLRLKIQYSWFDSILIHKDQRSIQCPTPEAIAEAIPKYISGRTSYRQVR